LWIQVKFYSRLTMIITRYDYCFLHFVDYPFLWPTRILFDQARWDFLWPEEQKIEKFGNFLENFQNSNPNQKWLTRPNPGNKNMTQTHQYTERFPNETFRLGWIIIPCNYNSSQLILFQLCLEEYPFGTAHCIALMYQVCVVSDTSGELQCQNTCRYDFYLISF